MRDTDHEPQRMSHRFQEVAKDTRRYTILAPGGNLVSTPTSKMFDIARIAAETKKIENDIYRDFITHTSNYEDSVDLEKFRRLIPEEKIV